MVKIPKIKKIGKYEYELRGAYKTEWGADARKDDLHRRFVEKYRTIRPDIQIKKVKGLFCVYMS